MQHLVVSVLVLLVASTPAPAAAKPPPSAPGPGDGPGVSPWATYAGKKGPVQDRSLLGLEGATSSEDTSGSLGSSGIGSPFGGPMSPFLKLKPFLPAKPAFAPPVVDPSKFIDMKADFLSSLFPGGVPMAAAPGVVAGAAPAGYLSSRALFSPFDTPAAPVVTKAPPPAFLADLFKALSINKTVANASDTPVFPGPTPLIDPTVFISKKAKFLSDLFASLPTTPAPAPTPDPAALNVELAASFQRVLDALAATERPPLQDAPEDEVEQALTAKEKRSMDSSAAVLGLTDAKDKVVDTIISELAELKDSMVGAVADLANAQKAADAAAAATAPKKPLSPYAAMWAKPTAAKASLPTAVPLEPVRQKVVLLGHVFDILTDMEKDIASSMAISLNTIQNVTETPTPSPDVFDVLKARISQIVEQQNSTSASPATANQTTPLTSSKTLRLAGEAVQAPTPVLIDPSFWIPDSTASAPDTYLAKSKAFIATIMAAKSTPSPIMRRSYKPSYPLQGEGQESQTSLYPNPAEQQHKSGQNSPGIVYVPQQQQHHHHNHQPYWWK